MNKKASTILLIMLLTLISIIGTSCGTSAYVGEWTLFSAEDADGNLYAGGYAFETAELTLRDDGSGFLVLARDGKESEESTTIVWEEHDKEIELTGDDIAWLATINDGRLEVSSYGDSVYDKLTFVTAADMAAAEENAEVYYLASDETKTCIFLDNGLYKDEHMKARSGFYEQLDDGYQLSYYAAGDTEEQEVKLSTAQDATYGEVLMNGGKIWAYKDEAAARKAAEDNPYTGKWEAVEINYSGIVQKPDEVGLNFELVISPDGSLAAATNGEPDGEGTWEETEDGIAITDGTGSEMSGKLDGERLVVDFGDDFIVTMEKAD